VRPGAPGRLDRKDRRLALLLALIALLVYNANCRDISTGDTYPARFEPLTILRFGTVYMDDLEKVVRMDSAQPYWLLPLQGHIVSVYPLVTPLLVTPLYLPALLYLDHHGWGDVARVRQVALVMEKIAASAIAAAAAGLMLLLLRRRMSRGRAILLTIAFAFGTETWVIGSQALWQHGTAELLLIVALMAAAGEPTPRRLATAGLACGLVIANRPPDALLAAGIALYVPFWVRPLPRGLIFFAAAALPLAVTVAYDLSIFGNLSGGYGYILEHTTSYRHFFRFPFAAGLVGQLVSPGKGLFVYCPFLLLLPIGSRWVLRAPQRPLSLCLILGVALQLVLYSWNDWRGGFSYGPRYLTDMVPILVWLLAPVVESLRAAGLAVFAATGLFAIYVQLVGAFYYPGAGSDQLYYPGGPASDDFTNVWKPEDAAFLVEVRSGRLHALTYLDEWPLSR
jgi:hypothetical protein